MSKGGSGLLEMAARWDGWGGKILPPQSILFGILSTFCGF